MKRIFIKTFKGFIVGICILLIFNLGHALEKEGTLTKTNFVAGGCEIASMAVKYRFGNLLGEPTISGSFKWEAPNGTPADCLGYSTTIFIKIATGPSNYGYVRLAPTVPKAAEGYGFNTTGSPNWGSLIRTSPNSEQFLSENTAKAFWKSGFMVESFEVVSIEKEIKKKEDDGDDQNGYGPENVYWPSGGSPPGKYKVKLYTGNSFTTYKVRVFANGRVYFYKGTLNRKGETDSVVSFKRS